MQDYGSICEDRRSRRDNEDWFIGDESEPIHSHPVREMRRHKERSPSLCFSSALESETLDGSISSLSCFSTTSISSDSESEAEDSGIFELEL